MRTNAARLLIAAVFLMNLQCAVLFLAIPGVYSPGFELSGAVGEAMIRGMGVLFLMWNVPYALALWHPVRNRLSLLESLAMQAIGLIGENLIFASLDPVHLLARQSVSRFILYDALGLLALLLAVLLTHFRRKEIMTGA